MKSVITIAATICVLAVCKADYVWAQNQLDLYADNAMSQCSLVDTSPGLKTVYVFLNGPAAATGVGFSAPVPACWQGATWVTDILPGPRGTTGNTQGEFFITLYVPGNSQCLTPPVLVCSILFLTTGNAPACCKMSVVPIPNPVASDLPLYYHDCLVVEQPLAVGQQITVNENASCPCQLPVATQPSTWGRVKSLYR